MAEFKRELRYAVFKLKHLSQEQLEYLDNMPGLKELPPLECAVVEADWPMYEGVWMNVERMWREYNNIPPPHYPIPDDSFGNGY